MCRPQTCVFSTTVGLNSGRLPSDSLHQLLKIPAHISTGQPTLHSNRPHERGEPIHYDDHRELAKTAPPIVNEHRVDALNAHNLLHD